MKKLFCVLSAASLFLFIGATGGLEQGKLPLAGGSALMFLFLAGWLLFASLAGAFSQKKSALRDSRPHKAHTKKHNTKYSVKNDFCQGGKRYV